jgi:dienelactone hydrolase
VGTIAISCCLLFAISLPGQGGPGTSIKTERFLTRGHQVTYEELSADSPNAVLILLHGASGPSVEGYRHQAAFFASHVYRTLLLHYYDATSSRTISDKNYAAWAAAVGDLIAHVREGHRDEKVYLVGYSLGASVALAAGSQGAPVSAIADWFGSLPDAFFHKLKGMPPLLILHGQRDAIIPVANAEQLIRLCGLEHFACDSHIYADQGHGFVGEARSDADARTLEFFAQH